MCFFFMQKCFERTFLNFLTFSRSIRFTGMFRPTTTITVLPQMSTPAQMVTVSKETDPHFLIYTRVKGRETKPTDQK